MKKEIDKNFFKKWTLEMSYILGFLFADGNITTNNRGANYFSFYSMDREILSFAKKAMKSRHKLSKRNARSGEVYRLQIGSKEMVEDLLNLGLVNAKVSRMKFPDIPKKYLPQFILGFFDGDGNVWTGEIHKKRKTQTMAIQTAFTSSSEKFLTSLQNELKKNGIKGGFIYHIKNKNCARLILSIKDSLKLYEIMYNDNQPSFFLKRKRKVFEKYINLRP
jgi:intein-encoded DNA endonuclease-like protein